MTPINIPSTAIQTMARMLESGQGKAEFVAKSLATYNVPLALLWYLQGPIVTIQRGMLPQLPAWVQPVIYTERFDLILAESSTGIAGDLAADADTLIYLLSAVRTGQLSPEWATPYGRLADAVLCRHNIRAEQFDAPDIYADDCGLSRDGDSEPDQLRWLRTDLREAIVRFARMQEITRPPACSPQLIPAGDTLTFQQIVARNGFTPPLAEVSI